MALFAEDIGKLIVVQNLIYGNVSYALDRYGSQIAGGQPGVVISHDQFSTTATTYQIIGNTFVGNYAYGNLSYGSNLRGEEIDIGEMPAPMSPIVSAAIENNLFVQLNNNGVASCELDSRTVLDWSNNDVSNTNTQLGAPGCTPATAIAAADLQVDPQFLNAAANDYHTQRTSPVVAAGTVNAPSIPATDFDGKNRTVCGTIDMGIYEVHPQPPIALTSAPNPAVGGTSVTLSAHLTGNCNVPTGTVTFLDGAGTLATSVLDAAGNTSLSTSALTVGTHNLTVTYPGDFNFDSSNSNTLVQVVTGYPTTTTLNTVAPNPAQALQAITLSAAVSSQFGIPSGTVSFYAGNTLLATAPLNAAGQAGLSTSTLGAGTYAITAVYNASTLFAGSTSAAINEIVNGAATATSLTSAPNPSSFGQSVTFTAVVTAPQSSALPTGTVSFRDGAMTLGSATLGITGIAAFSTNVLAVGTHTITALYGGSPNDNSSPSNKIVQVVGLSPVQVVLTGAPNPANSGQIVTLVATVSSVLASLPAPTGTVFFADQSRTLGSVSLTNGQAVLLTSNLAIGTHDITASFAGTGNFGAGLSPTLVEVVEAHDFSLVLSPATLSLVAGKAGQVNVVLSSAGSFSGTLMLSASQVPTYGSAAFSPPQVSLAAGATAQATLSIDTASVGARIGLQSQPDRPNKSRVMLTLAAFTVLPLLALRRRRLPVLMACLMLGALLWPLTGCTNVYAPVNTVVPGTYNIPVTATDSVTQISHTATLTLIVTSHP